MKEFIRFLQAVRTALHEQGIILSPSQEALLAKSIIDNLQEQEG